MRSSLRLLMAVALVGISVLPAGAQTRSPWSIQGSALYAGLKGEAFDGIDPGAGFEVQVRRKLAPVWSLGCGFQGTYHSYSAPSGSGLAGDMKLQGAFCEPRRLVDINSESVFPYVSVRAAFLRESLSLDFDTGSDVQTVTGSADGATINGGAGVMMPFGNTSGDHPTLLEIGASVGYTKFGDLTARGNGQSASVSGANGWNFVLRVGIAIGLGSSKP